MGSKREKKEQKQKELSHSQAHLVIKPYVSTNSKASTRFILLHHNMNHLSFSTSIIIPTMWTIFLSQPQPVGLSPTVATVKISVPLETSNRPFTVSPIRSLFPINETEMLVQSAYLARNVPNSHPADPILPIWLYEYRLLWQSKQLLLPTKKHPPHPMVRWCHSSSQIGKSWNKKDKLRMSKTTTSLPIPCSSQGWFQPCLSKFHKAWTQVH